MNAEQPAPRRYAKFWRCAFFAAETATFGSIGLALYLDELTRPLWRIHAEFIGPYWLGAGVCALFLLLCSIIVRRYDYSLCRVGIYSLLALPLLIPLALQAIQGGRVY